MTARARRAILIGVAVIYVAGLGFLAGIMVERMRFDVQRTATLTRLTAAEQRVRSVLMDIEVGASRRNRDGSLVLHRAD